MSFQPEKITLDSWLTIEPSKKRKRVQQSPKKHPNIQLKNNFETLNSIDSDDDSQNAEEYEAQSSSQNNATKQKKQKIPPIVVYSYVQNHTKTLKAIRTSLKEDFHIRTKKDRIIIYTNNLDDYKKMLEEIEKSKAGFHTYTLPSEKVVKLVIKGLPPNINSEEIHEELKLKNLEVDKVKQMIKLKANGEDKLEIKLPIYIVEFKPNTRINDVVIHKNICYCKVTWEIYRSATRIIQCFRCQDFGHIAINCHRPLKCVVCAENHSLKDCKLKNSSIQKCANCGEKHAANDKRCVAYEKVIASQNRGRPVRNIIARPRSTAYIMDNTTKTCAPNQPATPNDNVNKPSYAQTLRDSLRRADTPDVSNNLPLGSMIEELKTLVTNVNLTNIICVIRETLTKLNSTKDSVTKLAYIVEAIVTLLE